MINYDTYGNIDLEECKFLFVSTYLEATFIFYFQPLNPKMLLFHLLYFLHEN